MADLHEKIIYKLLKKIPKTADDFSAVLRSEMRGSKIHEDLSRKTDLLRVYHAMLAKGKIKKSPALEYLLTKRAVRTMSGVAIITVLTKPYKCPGQCIYCPDEPEMPKSYISDEPAAARALSLQFDPHRQVCERIKTLTSNGHPTDKIELIVKGGTWNAYPLAYQYWFILRCFEAANNSKSHPELVSGSITNHVKMLKQVQHDTLKKLQHQLYLAQKKNEIAKHRIIGVTLETRPDHITEKNILTMRELGCTRIELGVQTTDDKILKIIRRGHDTAETKRATELLKNYGFKVDYHLMPQLPGATPAKDAQMLTKIFSNPSYRPDMIKIYPCTVVKKSPLFKWVKSGKFKPYSDKKLVELLINFKTTVPRYVRISRLIRDIPGHHIIAGNRVTNLRQVIQAEMKRRNLRCNCLRCREVGHASPLSLRGGVERRRGNLGRPKLFVDKYQASGGTEYFLSYEDAKRQVAYAFCRLRICHCEEVEGRRSNLLSVQKTAGLLRFARNDTRQAFIRELHTYGQMLKIGARNTRASQHKGMGVKLVKEAEKLAAKSKASKIAVISGVGVRDYYRKLGYKLNNTYMIKDLCINKT
ncbi:MAG: tRNA uridine(34) 5-carboxymethylaminomethyl modification radical SAM/GNAT enzyme Elp3 [Candidatus Magasanikbacteria bacterium]|nr:tRNA uridine(34) 5-carboxymethylaminomethyl modification radical SAM/GNAT enzyme Elp3 [Candidatus Magasanikbacteria bacterium]